MTLNCARGGFRISAALLLSFNFGATLDASPITVIDQQNPGPFTTTNGAGVPPFSFGQSFTPTLNSIDAIEFLIGGTNATVHVDLLNGLVGTDGLGGAVLGTSNSLFVNVTPQATFQFDFPTSLTLIPGQTYVARLTMTSGSGLFMRETLSNAYAGGQFLNEGVPFGLLGGQDQVFTEGLVHAQTAVPEPSTVILLAVGLVGLLPIAIGRTFLKSMRALRLFRSVPVDSSSFAHSRV
jgi:hypothetical protein